MKINWHLINWIMKWKHLKNEKFFSLRFPFIVNWAWSFWCSLSGKALSGRKENWKMKIRTLTLSKAALWWFQSEYFLSPLAKLSIKNPVEFSLALHLWFNNESYWINILMLIRTFHFAIAAIRFFAPSVLFTFWFVVLPSFASSREESKALNYVHFLYWP